jgi:hypothetical protein
MYYQLSIISLNPHVLFHCKIQEAGEQEGGGASDAQAQAAGYNAIYSFTQISMVILFHIFNLQSRHYIVFKMSYLFVYLIYRDLSQMMFWSLLPEDVSENDGLLEHFCYFASK